MVSDTEKAEDRPATGRKIRVVVAKPGLDGHDRGAKIAALALRDAGFEVIYTGIRQKPAQIAAVAAQEDVDVVGLSMHNAAHRTLAPKVVRALREAGLDTPVVVGGIVPDVDVPHLLEAGVARVLGPGASAEEVVEAVRQAAAAVSARS